jgi:hypothetical protein
LYVPTLVGKTWHMFSLPIYLESLFMSKSLDKQGKKRAKLYLRLRGS